MLIAVDRLERPALILVDLENEIVRGKLSVPGAEQLQATMLANCQRLLAAAREQGIPVFFSRIAFRPDYADASPHAPVVKVPHLRGLLVVDTWGTQIVDELTPRPDEVVITKKRTSAFFATELDLILRRRAVSSVVLAGTATNRAVEGTARDAHALDYDVVVVQDATAAQKAEFHEPSLRSMADFIARIATTDEILDTWVKTP
jgi:nicotinamidase-related amidase